MHSIGIWIQAFSGLGLFLFGMLYLETQIKAAAGHSFKKLIKNTTDTSLKSIFSGIGTTAVFQSSSVVSLMVLSLIGAKLMSLQSAVAVIFGANLGTTATAWIMAFVGFKMDINFISYVIIGIGGLGSVLSFDGNRWKNYFGVMVGIGLIFLGLGVMKESLEVFSKNFDISAYTFANPYWYAVVGLAVTAIIQSSSASIAIIQSALFAQIIGFEAAAAFVVGTNIGTTVTVILGSLGGTSNKKRTAMAHFLFNLSTGLVALALLKPLIYIVNFTIPDANSVIKIALFHTIFNSLGILLWYPFISRFALWLQQFFKKEPILVTKYIHNVPSDIPDLAQDALKKEIDYLSQNIEEFALFAINIPPTKAFSKGVDIDTLLNEYNKNFDIPYKNLYEKIRLLEGEIYRYISTLAIKNQDETYQESLSHLSRKTTYLTTAAKAIEDMLYDLERLYNASSNEEQEFYKNLRHQILKNILAFHQARKGNKISIAEIENIYKKIVDSYKNSIKIVGDIAKNLTINSEMMTIVINDMHLTKSFSKSLRNALNA